MFSLLRVASKARPDRRPAARTSGTAFQKGGSPISMPAERISLLAYEPLIMGRVEQFRRILPPTTFDPLVG
jgi:hypothetical protein